VIDPEQHSLSLAPAGIATMLP
ncbi:MAG: hypothetical protein JWP08_4569, partial [Bryobacterales bacterium]|nr:hypothetical protein [Bryobacterales bacterium]